MQTLWENFPDRRQFEETHTKNTWRKNCNFCGKFFLDRRQSEVTHTNNTWNKNCNFCGKIFKCKFCGKIFQTEGNLKKHMQKTHEENIASFVGFFFDQRQFEESHANNTWNKNCNYYNHLCVFCQEKRWGFVNFSDISLPGATQTPCQSLPVKVSKFSLWKWILLWIKLAIRANTNPSTSVKTNFLQISVSITQFTPPT